MSSTSTLKRSNGIPRADLAALAVRSVHSNCMDLAERLQAFEPRYIEFLLPEKNDVLELYIYFFTEKFFQTPNKYWRVVYCAETLEKDTESSANVEAFLKKAELDDEVNYKKFLDAYQHGSA